MSRFAGAVASAWRLPATRQIGADQLLAVIGAMPAALVCGLLNAAIVATLRSDEVAGRLRAIGMQPEMLNPSDAAAFIAADARRWADVIRTANIAPE